MLLLRQMQISWYLYHQINKKTTCLFYYFFFFLWKKSAHDLICRLSWSGTFCILWSAISVIGISYIILVSLVGLTIFNIFSQLFYAEERYIHNNGETKQNIPEYHPCHVTSANTNSFTDISCVSISPGAANTVKLLTLFSVTGCYTLWYI